jgi:5-methylcytosine-specific restriction enzyme subunit McrC
MMDSIPVGYVGRIPIRNVWLLMLYASELYRELDSAARNVEDNPEDIPDLVATMLTRCVERRLQRNLTQGYRERKEILGRVRGRIDHLTTEAHMLLERGKVACSFDELSTDTPRNRSVRAALLRLSRLVKDRELGTRCASLASRLWEAGVTGEPPDWRSLSLETFGRNDAAERQMVSLAKLAFDLALPTEEQGARQLATPDREEHWLRKLFERAVGGFFDCTLDRSRWRVSTGEWLEWPIGRSTTRLGEIFPAMKTDIVLEDFVGASRIIIDTKFTEIVHTGWHREETLRSANIYQIYSYLRSQEQPGDSLSNRSTGILLHPSFGIDYNEAVELQGHVIRFMTIDLTLTSSEIKKSLLMVQEFPKLLESSK